ncbi:MAG: type IX secretion system sortase PorU, partial [Melioribacteraceae bacterium]|nr:type IX secretion system sortase PorU [Melioribacteraceae bacterium]
MTSKFSKIIFLTLIIPIFISGQNLEILDSNPNSITISFKPNFNIDTISINDKQYLQIDFLGSVSDSFGDSLQYLPFKIINLGVPSEFGNTIQVLSQTEKIINGEILPSPELKKYEFMGEFQFAEKLNSTNEKLKQINTVEFADFGYVRELGVQSIKLNPVQLLEESARIKLITQINFKINYSPQKSDLTEINSDFLSQVVENFDVSQKWGKANRTLQKKSDSNLADGIWYKFTVAEEGIFRITRSMLTDYGIDASTVDPRTIKIYNNGGYVLPENIDSERPDGIIQNSILVVGESDGSFDANDYILFYARTTNFWEYDSTLARVARNKHWFDNSNYYWITSGGDPGKRMVEKSGEAKQDSYSQSVTSAYKYLDDDKINLHKSGKVYFGDELNSSRNSITYTTALPQLVSGSKIDYVIQFANAADRNINLNVLENNVPILSFNMAGTTDYVFGRVYNRTASISGTLADNRSLLKFQFDGTGPTDIGYVDFFEIEYQKNLYAENDQLFFFSKDTTANIFYTLMNFSNSDIFVFDVSDFANVKIITNESISAGQLSFTAAEKEDNISKYLSVNSAKFLAPGKGTKVENSNIRGITQGAELIVISNKIFSDEVERYANYRQNESPFPKSTQILYVDEIYNEYSGGMVDPTSIRDAVKDAFENWNTKPEFVLLFGDGDYDYLDKEAFGRNFVPTYQKDVSLSRLLYELLVYPTDDYFVQIAGGNADRKVDLATGRLNVNSLEEAKIMVDKIISYENNEDKGLWRNTITLVGDDGWTSHGDDGALHTSQSEDISNNYIPNTYNQNKIYLSAYPTVNTGAGRRKPDVNDAIVNAMNSGNLILNFVGHGNPEVWAHERVFEKATTIPRINNDRPFFLTAATCDFGKYDDPSTPSATEEMLLIEQGGLIAGFTASRPVYASPNHSLNRALYSNLLQTKDADNLPLEIGKALFNAKQIVSGENAEKFHILGDPTLRLVLPTLPVTIDSVNKSPLNLDVQLSALGDVNLNGTIKNLNGTLNNNFNGEAIVSVFDSERSFHLDDINYDMGLQGGLIFRGRASIKNGKFSTSFVVPKDISYENKNGKIVAYIFNNETDGIGSTNKIIIGGSDSTAVNDKLGPEIDIYFDDLSYSNSFLVKPDFNLLVRLEDETGLNTTGTGVGHKLEGVLNANIENTIDFTNHFVGDLDAGGKAGLIDYRFSNLSMGEYNIEVKAWDVFNNFSTEESIFKVVNANDALIEDIYNYPNPFSSTTSFTFKHSLDSD